jgi:hypothetical protein
MYKRTIYACLLLAVAHGCVADTSVEGLGAEALDEGVAGHAAALVSGNATVGSFYQTSVTTPYTGAVMRQWGASNAPILRQVAAPALVRAERAAPTNGFYQVSHAGTWGWISGQNLTLSHGALSTTLSTQRRTAIDLGRTALGFSYWWSNGRWLRGGATTWPTENIGDCNGTCGGTPQCTHVPTPTAASTEYGADCSGFLSTVWGFPDQNPEVYTNGDGFATVTYSQPVANRWSNRTIAGSLPGDAVVRYNTTSRSGHIVLVVTTPNSTGFFRTYECEGCSTGCRSRTRTILDSNTDGWHGIRRVGTGWGG